MSKRFVPFDWWMLVGEVGCRTDCCIGRIVEPPEAFDPRSESMVLRAGEFVVFRHDAGTPSPQFGEQTRILSWGDVLGKAEGFDA